MKDCIKIIGGSSHPILVNDICEYISSTLNKEINPVNTTLTKFSDGETSVEINENVRNKDVYVIQSLCNPTNDNLMELLLIMDALRRSDVKSMNLIIPYYGYSRQDKKTKSRVPISASVVSELLQIYNPNRIITLDLHAPQIQGFFHNIPVDNLYGSMIFLDYIKQFEDIVCVSPDAGGMERVTSYSKSLGCNMGFCYKHREEANKIDRMKLIGEVKDKNCIIIDDLCDTGGTLKKCSEMLLNEGAKSVRVVFTHAVLSGNGIRNLTESNITDIVTSNSIPSNQEVLQNNKFTVIQIDELLSEVIVRLQNGRSLSELFV